MKEKLNNNRSLCLPITQYSLNHIVPETPVSLEDLSRVRSSKFNLLEINYNFSDAVTHQNQDFWCISIA